MQWPKDSLFNKWSWNNWIATCKQMKLDLSQYLTQSITPLTIINSKKDWRLKFHDLTMKLLEENIGGNEWFSGYDTKSTVKKKKKCKDNLWNRRKSVKYKSTKKLIYKIYKELIHSIAKKPHNYSILK